MRYHTPDTASADSVTIDLLARLELAAPQAAVAVAGKVRWVAEPVQHRGPLERLTPQERAVYEDLGPDRLGRNLRLEQKRIAFGRVLDAVRALDRRPSAGTAASALDASGRHHEH